MRVGKNVEKMTRARKSDARARMITDEYILRAPSQPRKSISLTT